MASTVLQVLLLCLTCGLTSGRILRACEGAEFPRGIHHHFYLVQNKLTWPDAELHCVAQGGNLASVHCQDEHDYVKGRANEGPIWIGGHDATEEGKWLWSDGSAFDFTSWGSGAPGNRKKGEHCMEMNNLGAMNVKSCAEKKPFVCAKIISM